MTFRDATAVFGPGLLCNPAPEAIEGRMILPLEYFSDEGIHTMDYPTWAAAERHYLAYEREHLDKLTGQIEKYGLLDRVKISWHGPGYQPHMYDGHHRIVVLRRLGWTHAPYRWHDAAAPQIPGYPGGDEPRWSDEPFPWHPAGGAGGCSVGLNNETH